MPRPSRSASDFQPRITGAGESRKVCILNNFIAPNYVAVLERLKEQLGDLSILISTPMERNRSWEPPTGKFKLVTQKTLTFTYRRKHEMGFSDEAYVHIPYDTLPALWRMGPEIVISAQFGFRSFQAALYRKLNPKSRLVLWIFGSEHTEAGSGIVRTSLRRLLLTFADALLINGVSGARYLQSLGVPAEKIFYLPCTIDIAPYLSVPVTRQPDAARRLIYFGQLIERKGLLPFLREVSRWLSLHPGKRCDMWIVGEGPGREEIESAHWPAELSLKFLGSVPYSALPQFYAQAGILAFPTLSDEWGVVVNEALAAGLPVLGSRYSQAVEELIEEGANGWTFRTDHPEEIHNALDRMMSTSDEMLERMRNIGRQSVSSITPEFGAKCFLQAIEFARASVAAFSGEAKKSANNEFPRAKTENLLR